MNSRPKEFRFRFVSHKFLVSGSLTALSDEAVGLMAGYCGFVVATFDMA